MAEATNQQLQLGERLPSPERVKRRQSLTVPPTRTVRLSEEFDKRYDGPFGRPSLTMRSSSEARTGSLNRSQVQNGDGASEQRTDIEQPEERRHESNPIRPWPTFQPEPPSLNYTLRTRKLTIVIFWTVIIFDSVIMHIDLYFGLWYGVGPGSNREKLSANTVFSIVTAAVGGASIIEYFLRFWRLWKKDSKCRVIDARSRWYLDWFHWNFSLAWIIVMIELILGTYPERPPIRLLSMPLTTMLFVFGIELFLVDILHFFHVPAPLRISSIPRGGQLRPGIYSLIEDICAVDGSGGTAFREALDRRYKASHIFRAMLRRLGVFWSVGAEAIAVLCAILIFTIDDDVAYTIGWSVPFIWAGVWTFCTFCYVKRGLRKEKKVWREEVMLKHPA